jgi:hypothetical protein
LSDACPAAAKRRLMPATGHPRHDADRPGSQVNYVLSEYDLDQHHVRLLTLAAEAWETGQEARAAIAKHSAVYVDRFGAPRKRPEVAIQAEARIAFARLLRELDLDPPAVASRPPALQSNRRL